jgi:tetratricopeptide (TPR) repeat protein
MSEELEQSLDDAWSARREGRLDVAQALALEAARVSRAEKRRTQLVRALQLLSQVERDRGNLDAALPYLYEAVAQARMVSSQEMLAHTSRHLGDLYQELRRFQQAEYCYAEALELYENLPNTRDIELANATRPLALLMERTGQPAQAATYWRAALQLYDSADVEEGVLECRQAIERCNKAMRQGR